MLPIATDVAVSWLIHMSSVTLVHPTKVIRRNEMLFGSDTDVVLRNIVLDGPHSPTENAL